MRILRLAIFAPLLSGLWSGPPAFAQAWPTVKPITMVVPFPPGPALDLVARSVASKIGPALGQSIVVENRVGANGTIGSNLVARAAPDGYTLLAATAGTHVTAVHLMKSLPYDPVKDFSPIVAAVEPVTCLAVSAALPVSSVEELIAYAKSHPDELSFGSSGRRIGVPPDGRIVQRDRGRQDQSCAISRCRAGHAGCQSAAISR